MKTHKLQSSEGNLATGVRAIFLITVIGLIAGVSGLSAFGPQSDLGIPDGNPDAAVASAPNTAVDKSGTTDAAVSRSAETPGYFPSQFPAPRGENEPPPPTF